MPNPFESFNARFVDPGTVAQTFILRDKEFTLLCEQNNSVLIGPRGSGKTTLLKMLKIGAQIAWKNRKQAKVLRRFSFAPIYVGAERQLDVKLSGAKVHEDNTASVRALAKALLCFRIKFACIDTVKEITNPRLSEVQELSHQFVNLGSSERDLCEHLSVVWSLPVRAQSFLEVTSLLIKQLSDINTFVDRVRYGEHVSVTDMIDKAEFITQDPIHATSSFISMFNSIVDRPTKIWALCIDEIEIMPDDLQAYLFSCLRSVDQRLILKLATSPFSSIDWASPSDSRPMAGHDFTPINLSYTRKAESRQSPAKKFSSQLLDAMIAAEGKYKSNRPTGQDVLGRSPIAEANTEPFQRGAYAPPDGEHYRRFKRLRETDPAFRTFLDNRRIDIDRAAGSAESQRASQMRKYIWPVAVRLEYGSVEGADSSLRPKSRKRIPSIYLGYDSLLTMCEGNPRITIALLRPLVRYFVGTKQTVPEEIQSRAVEEAIAKFVSLISTIRLDDPSRRGIDISSRSAMHLVENVGRYFQKQVNDPKEFKSEPHLTFRVDDVVPQEHVDAIGAAMNQGAFAMVSDEHDLFDFGSLRNARVRLSYLLCPMYHLPLIIGSSAIYSRIAQSRTVSSFRQGELFDRSDDV